MPANNAEFQDAFRDMVGHAGAEEAWYGERIGGWSEWRDLFMSTGIDFDSHTQTIDAFENFLVAFYPQEGLSRDEWDVTRDEFYDLYGITYHDIDWEDYREAIGYGRE